MRITHSVSAFSIAVLVVCGCSRSTSASSAPQTRIVEYSTEDPSAVAELRLRGIRVTVDGPIKNELSLASHSSPSVFVHINMDSNPPPAEGEDPECRFWIRAEPMVLRDGHLWIGTYDHGKVSESDEVHIDANGVHVDGERRGPLPAR